MDEVLTEVAAASRHSLLVLGACAEFVVQSAKQGDERANRLLAMVRDAERRLSLAYLEADIVMPSARNPA